MRKPASTPLNRLRLSARAPRVSLMAACAALTLGGAARTFAPPTPSAQPVQSQARADTTREQGFAERFTLEYLTFGADRDARLRVFGFESTGTADRPATKSRRVRATAIASVSPVIGGANVTVAARSDSGWQYLDVPVRRHADRLFVAAPPAIVGAPLVARDALPGPEDEVQSPALTRVAERVMRHYLAGDRADLSADLAPRVAIATPVGDLRVASVEAVTWAAAPRRVAVVLRARGSRGLRLTLRYELGVVRRDGRWLVTGIADTPTHEEHPR